MLALIREYMLIKNIVKLNHRLNKGDIIEVQITKNESQNIIPEDIDIDVIYEDLSYW